MAKQSPFILVTGGAGYVGFNFIRECLALGWKVRCLDLLIYGGKALAGFMNHPNFELIKGDVRVKADVERALEGVTVVVHLAAVVGDMPCQAAPKSAYQINFKGTQMVADLAKKKKIERFIFASTCSNYGVIKADTSADEDHELNPVSLYAETKIDCEKYLMSIADEKFHPTYLRFGTAYGVSQRTRFDLAVNSFVYEAIFKKELVVFAARMWRPYVHVADMTTIMLNILNADVKKVSNQVFNAGATAQNFMKEDVVQMIVSVMPGLKVRYATDVDDQRNYRVNFAKLEKIVGFKPTRTVLDGIKELVYCFQNGILTENDYESNNLDQLKQFFSEQEALRAK